MTRNWILGFSQCKTLEKWCFYFPWKLHLIFRWNSQPLQTSPIFYKWKKKEDTFKNLKWKYQFYQFAKNHINIWTNQKFQFLKRTSIKTLHKCGRNAKSHPNAKGRKQLDLWIVRIGQEAINQSTSHSSDKYVRYWIGWNG